MNKQEKDIINKEEEIDLSQKKSVEYWTARFDVTKVKLKAAVNAVGPAVKDVETWLKKK
jgi:hypothetical protein